MRIKTVVIPTGKVSLISGQWNGVYVHLVAHNHMLAIEKARVYVESLIRRYNQK